MEVNSFSRQGLIAHDRVWIAAFVFAFLGLMVDGADLMFLSYSLSSLKREFGLSNIEAGALGSITLAGMAIGGIYGGGGCDRFGRVRTMVWTIAVFSIGTAALGFTHNFSQFAAFRFIAALGLGAQYVACNTLMSEYAPTRIRTTILGTLQAGWSVGYVVATVLAGWILPAFGWRYLFFISIVPVVLALVMQRMVPEPESYVASRNARPRSDVVGKEQGVGAMKLVFGDPARCRMFM